MMYSGLPAPPPRGHMPYRYRYIRYVYVSRNPISILRDYYGLTLSLVIYRCNVTKLWIEWPWCSDNGSLLLL